MGACEVQKERIKIDKRDREITVVALSVPCLSILYGLCYIWVLFNIPAPQPQPISISIGILLPVLRCVIYMYTYGHMMACAYALYGMI
jgi:hypothetical protein